MLIVLDHFRDCSRITSDPETIPVCLKVALSATTQEEWSALADDFRTCVQIQGSEMLGSEMLLLSI